jgi:glycosyltransferase involved in cell wall biosynthesis
MKKKILYVDNRSQYFVANRLPLAKAARDRLAEVHVTTLSRREQDVEIIVSNGLSFHKLRCNATTGSIVKPVFMALELARLFKKLAPDFIHFFTLKAMCVGSMAFLLTRRTTAVMTVTGLGYTFTSHSLKALFLRAVLGTILAPMLKRSGEYFVFQNPDDLSFFHDHLRFPCERSYLIKGSGVDISRYMILPDEKGVPTIMLASRMLRDKGIFEFVESARQLKLKGVQVRFLLVGDIDLENPAGIPRSQLMEWHDSGIIEWRGYCPDMLPLFSEAHIVCLPSYGEGVPKVLIEGAACGRPLVTTNVPGCREVVRHEENGLLVPPADSQALSGALLRLIRDAKLRESMGRRGRVLVENEFSLEKVIDETFKIYERILHA